MTKNKTHSNAVAPLITKAEIGTFLAGFAVALAMLTTPLPGDPLDYLDAAENLWSSELFHRTTRIGITIPVWLLTLVFGYSEVSLYTLPILGTATLAAVTTMLGRILFNKWVGIAAAIAIITSPWVLPYATQLLPDIGSASLVTLALALVVSAAPDRIHETNRLWIAGVVLGLAYLTKETSLLFLPALLVVMLVLKLPRMWQFLAGAVAVAGLEVAFGLLIWGDPLARINSLLLRSSTPPSPARTAANEAAFAAQSNPLESLTVFIQLLWSSPPSRIALMLGVVLLIGAIVKPSRRYFVLLAWVVVPWVLLAGIASIRPESGRPVIRLMLDRYWVAFLPPLAIGGFGVLSVASSRLRSRWTRRGAVSAISVFCIALAATGIWTSVSARPDWFVFLGNESYWDLRATLSSVEDERIVYIDENLQNLVRLYTNDPVGGTTFVGELSSKPTALANPSSWVLVDFEHSTGDFISYASANDLRVYAAAQDLRWAILAKPSQTESDPSPMSESALGSIPADSWQMRLIDETGSWGEAEQQPPEPVRLDRGEMVVFYDDRGSYRKPPEDSDLRFEPDRIAVVRIEMEKDSVGLRAVCDFYPVDGEAQAERVRAAALHHDGVEKDRLFAMCRSPMNGTPYDLRPVIIATGQGDISLGNAEVGALEAAAESGG